MKTERLRGCDVVINLSLFHSNKWLTTWCVAATPSALGKLDAGRKPVSGVAVIPTGSTGWQVLSAEVTANRIPAGTSRAAFYIDVGGGDGRIWFDDLDLWQPESAQ